MKSVGIIFSNIHDQEIKELTASRTLASVPYACRYRLIDFALSNMTNAGITNVGIITKHNYQSLMEHCGSGKNWDLSRKNGGLTILPPFGDNESKMYTSRFEALGNAMYFLRSCSEDYVVMSDCDNVCNIDLSELVEYHIAKAADITVVYRRKYLPLDAEVKTRTQFDLDADNRITRTYIGKNHEDWANKMANILVINRKFLINLIENKEEFDYHSFSRDVLVRGVDKYRIFGFRFDGYYATVDSFQNYYKHNMELLDKSVRDALFRANGASIYTNVRDSAPCKFVGDGKATNSLIADGCVIEGEVSGSILFRGVRVAKGAVVRNSIIFQNANISEGSFLNCVVADKETTVLSGRTLSGHETHPYFIPKGSVI